MEASSAAIVVAGGRGRRMNADRNKQYLKLGDRPVLAHPLQTLEEHPGISFIIVVVAEGEMEYCHKKVIKPYGFRKVYRVVTGGKRRQDSVNRGLEVLQEREADLVLVHDGARPFLGLDVVSRTLEAAEVHGAATAAIKVKDTITVNGQGFISGTLKREELRAVQTPQAFRTEWLLMAHESAYQQGVYATDDAALMMRAGYPVKLVRGSDRNIKITTPADMNIALALFRDDAMRG